MTQMEGNYSSPSSTRGGQPNHYNTSFSVGNSPIPSPKSNSNRFTGSILPRGESESGKVTAEGHSTPTVGSGNRGNGFRNLSLTEYNSRMERGLCFRCDEKYHPGHRCRARRLQVMIYSEDGDEENLVEEEEEEGSGAVVEEQLLALNLNSLASAEGPQTIKFRAGLCGCEVWILVDSGATHNFVASHLVEKLGLAVEKGKHFLVMLGDGERISGEGVCRGLKMNIQGFEVSHDFFPFQLG